MTAKDIALGVIARKGAAAATGCAIEYTGSTVDGLSMEARMTGGPTPNGCLRPVKKGPFYAIELRNGTIGTSGGMRIDADARVLGYGGSTIPGLYAAGNASACVFGGAYPGGGGTIGPALTFGFIAGRSVATEAGRSV